MDIPPIRPNMRPLSTGDGLISRTFVDLSSPAAQLLAQRSGSGAECSHEECRDEAVRKGYCPTHYWERSESRQGSARNVRVKEEGRTGSVKLDDGPYLLRRSMSWPSTWSSDLFDSNAKCNGVEMSTLPRPMLRPFTSQAGGHGKILRAGFGRVLKPYEAKEASFYLRLPEYHEFQYFTPKYYETCNVGGQEYIVLDDVVAGLEKPCVLDIKLGRSQVAPDLSPRKAARSEARSKATTSYSHGFRICGMKVWDPFTSQYRVYKKDFGKAVSEETLLPSLLLFYQSVPIEMAIRTVDKHREKLAIVLHVFENQRSLKFFSSSLLFTYEAEEKKDSSGDVKLIDFAHVFPSTDGSRDESSLFGLQTLQKTLAEVRWKLHAVLQGQLGSYS